MQNQSLEESIITALDGTDPRILKYIPYILQDFWELGTPPEDIIEIIKRLKSDYSRLSVLDLGSGKGAVSINLAKELKCKCFGIDGMEEFINFSNVKAKEYSVESICIFEKGDIRIRLENSGKFDVIILGAIGTVFGNYFETLTKLKSHLNKGGIIIINDAYINDNVDKSAYPNIFQKTDLMEQAENAGMELVYLLTDDEVSETTDEYKIELNNLTKRCMELTEKYPEDKDLFLGFIKKQTREYEILSNEIVPAIFVFKMIN